MGKRAVLFAGQGAQTVGMGKDLANRYADCRALFAQADAVLGRPLSRICFEGPEADLTRSDNCQPAIFVTSLACLRALELEGYRDGFACAAGLSLGEWTALHVAGVLGFDDTVRILDARGRFMQEACDRTQGSMVSVIGLDAASLETICETTGAVVANRNSDLQTVLSGSRAAVEQARAMAEEAGARRAVVLNVAGAFHSPLMAPAAERLAEVLQTVSFQTPSLPVPANATGKPHGAAESLAETMVRQVTGTVHWQANVAWMQAAGVTDFVECGPGRVLTGLIKRSVAGAVLYNVQDAASATDTAAAIGKENA